MNILTPHRDLNIKLKSTIKPGLLSVLKDKTNQTPLITSKQKSLATTIKKTTTSKLNSSLNKNSSTTVKKNIPITTLKNNGSATKTINKSINPILKKGPLTIQKSKLGINNSTIQTEEPEYMVPAVFPSTIPYDIEEFRIDLDDFKVSKTTKPIEYVPFEFVSECIDFKVNDEDEELEPIITSLLTL